jgi:hypothetical protein
MSGFCVSRVFRGDSFRKLCSPMNRAGAVAQEKRDASSKSGLQFRQDGQRHRLGRVASEVEADRGVQLG